MNRKKTVGLLVAAMGLSLALTGCGETTVQVEGLPQDFHAYEDNGDVNSTITIDNVDYTGTGNCSSVGGQEGKCYRYKSRRKS